MANKEMGLRIKKYRTQCNMTQQELADLLQLKNKSTLASWEGGKSEPDIAMIEKLCKIFSIDANTFFDYENWEVSSAEENDTKPIKSNNILITDSDEKILLNAYRELNTDNQAYIRIRMKELLKEQKTVTEFGDDNAVSKSVG